MVFDILTFGLVDMFKRMRRAEVASIPPSDGFSSEAKDKILADVYAAIPEEYVRSLPGIDLGFFGSIQSLVLDVRHLLQIGRASCRERV